MTGDARWFTSLSRAPGDETITFGDASCGTVMGKGTIKVNENFTLKDVALVSKLKYNLLSVSQLCDVDLEVRFKKDGSKVLDSSESQVFGISRVGRVYFADFDHSSGHSRCLVASSSSDLFFWHRRLGHIGFDHLTRLSGMDLVRGLPKLKASKDLVCSPCRHGKMTASSHPPVTWVMTDGPGQLLHMDTVGPARVQSVGGKWYVLVIVDDYSRYSWVFFLESKDETFGFFRDLTRRLAIEFPGALRAIRSDNGKEFKNASFESFCQSSGIEHQFSSPYVPQQNGVVERKNRTLVEMARTMLDEYSTPRRFWTEAISAACFISNRVFLRTSLHKTPYELRFGRRPSVSHFRVFGCKCFVLKPGNLDKFESRSSDAMFLGYADHSRAYKVLVLETNKIVETCEVTFDEASPGARPEISGTLDLSETLFVEEESDEEEDFPRRPPPHAVPIEQDEEFPSTTSPSANAPATSTSSVGHAEMDGGSSELTAPRHIQNRHPPHTMIGSLDERVTRNRSYEIAHSAFVASFEPKNVCHALSDENWVNAMHEELENFERNKVWSLVELPLGHNVIGTKWVFKNK